MSNATHASENLIIKDTTFSSIDPVETLPVAAIVEMRKLGVMK